MAKTRIVFDHLPEISRKMRADMIDLVATTAAAVADEWRATSPVRTGQLRDSIEIETAPAGTRARVIAQAGYAAHVEYGTHTRPARPAATPAALSHKADYLRQARKILD